MTQPVESSFSLSPDQASVIDTLVRDGRFEPDSVVVQAGLQALQDQVATIGQWLADDVAPVYDAMMSDPSRGRSVADVRTARSPHHVPRMDEERDL